MCFDRLTDEETVETSLPTLLATEWRCVVRNGELVAAVLLVQGTPTWLVLVSVAGAVALEAMLHQTVLLVGASLLRARARWRDSQGRTAT